MGFEKVVLNEVVEVLGEDINASFTNGTLFVVGCSVRDAVRLESALLEKINCGIIMSRFGNESAYDFVA